MKKTMTKMLALIAVLLLSVGNAQAQTGATLLDTNFEDWKTIIGTSNGTYTVPGATVKIQGPSFNNSSTPNAGTSTAYPNYFRFGSAGAVSNQYIEITPSASFVNGGRITLILSMNGTASATNIFTVADTKSWDTPLAEFNQIGKAFTTKTFDLPGTYTGTQTIRLYRTVTTAFLHAIKIETNPAAPATPAITSFTIGEVEATIDDVAETITAELPFGTDLTAITPDVVFGGSGKSYTPQGAQDFTSPVTYTVFDDLDPAAQGAVSKAYLVTLTAAISKSTDATLDSLAFKEVKLANFAPTTYEYSVVLEPTDAVPAITDVTYTTNYPTATAATPVRTSETLPTDITVLVTAEDETTTQTYTIHFTQRAISTDATLKALKVNGSNVPEFSASQLAYTVELPYNVTAVAVSGTATDHATITSVTQAADLQSTASIAVTAEDGLTTNTYTVSFTSQAEPTQEHKFWNFSDWETGDVTAAGTTVDGLTTVGASSIDSNSSSIDYYAFTKRFKTGGKSAASAFKPTTRYLSFPVAGDVSITVYGMTGNTSSARSLVVSDGTTKIGSLDDNHDLGTLKKVIVPYTGQATTIYLYADVDNFSIYAVGVVGKLTVPTDIATAKADKAVASVVSYDVLGRPVAANAKGLVITKTVYADGTSVSVKNYR